MRLVAERWTADNQEIEGIMNLLKVQAGLSQTKTQDLIDARVGVVKHMGDGEPRVAQPQMKQNHGSF